jgi:hypothetical protein
MTEKCVTCGGVVAERCPRCRRKGELLGRLAAHLQEIFWCGWCRRGFEAGAGGAKEKVCAACRPVQMSFGDPQITQITQITQR